MERLNLNIRRQNRLYRLVSFLIPCAVMLLCLALSGYYPFGEDSIFRGDAYAEYYPYIVLLRRILRNGESLLYTWRSGLGISLIPTAAYFCINFFNLIAVLLPEAVLPAFFSIAACVRIGLCGYFFAILLQTIRPSLTPSAVAFSTMFALCGWMLGSMHQLVWMDSVALLPLICAGMIRAVRDGDARLYPIALGLCIAFNYYIGFIICVMIGLCWIALLIILKKPLRSLWKETLRFLGLSALGGGLSAVLLLPTFLALRTTPTYGSSVTSWTEFYATLQEMIGGLAPFQYIVLNVHPGLFGSGILLVLLLGAYLISGRISLRERLSGTVLFLFLMLSIAYAPLNYVWHGLHYPHVTVQRFGFLVPFVLALIGWRYTETMHDTPLKSQSKSCAVLRTAFAGILMAGFTAAVVWCAAKYCEVDIPLVIAVCAVLYLLLYAFGHFFPQKRGVFYAFLVILVTCEMGLNMYLQNNNMKPDDLGRVLPDSTVVQAAEEIRADDAKTPEALHRTAVRQGGALGDDLELLYDIPQGSSIFSSMLPEETGAFCAPLGFLYSGYTCVYRNTTPFAMLLTDMQYVISDKPVSCAKPMQSGAEETDFLPYRFDYDTDLGFCVPDVLQLPEDGDLLGCDVQEQIFRDMTGIDESLFTAIAPESVSSEFMEFQQDGDLYSMQSDEASQDPETEVKVRPALRIGYEIPEDGDYYLFFRWTDDADMMMKNCELQVNESNVYTYAPGVYEPYNQLCLAAGSVKKDDEVCFVMNMYPMARSSIYVRLVRFEDDVFRSGYERLHSTQLRLSEFAQSDFTGTVTAAENSVLYLSVPYDAGWTAYVDGREVPVERMLKAMSGVRVSAGTHEIRMSFMPEGLPVGAAVSGGCLLIWLVIAAVQTIRFRRERSSVQNVYDSAENEKDEKQHGTESV
ncbi:MAG: YfhO family protein [Oscillospiraceae bacterium]|nr:YfhO family protein [Oscillospiraceae bacterium]